MKENNFDNAQNLKKLENEIFSISSSLQFNKIAIEVFQFQYASNAIYKLFVDNLNINKDSIKHYSQIPFLPIEFFKTHCIKSFEGEAEITFTSSGTTGVSTSKHEVYKSQMYYKSFTKSFELFFGLPENYNILALLPNYLERGGSSLVYMIKELISLSGKADSGFYLYNTDELFDKLKTLKNKEQKTILFGVSFALLDFVESYKIDFPQLIVMDTGGMKGKRKELTGKELHDFIKYALGIKQVYSEYGMTELLSQAYSTGERSYKTPPWMKVLICDTNDPLTLIGKNKTGGINIIDLANLYSCSFIATHDLGKESEDDSFEVLGRFDYSDVRGCNLMVL